MTAPIETRVLAVTGPPGSGKTTLTSALAKRLSAATVFYDDFEQTTRKSPQAVKESLQKHGDFRSLEVPGFAEAIRGARDTGDHRWLIVETQLGRSHLPSRPLIDTQIWIEAPLDIALARVLLKFSEEAVRTSDQLQARFHWQAGYLRNYTESVRETLCLQRRIIAADSDLIVDGQLTTAEQLEACLTFVEGDS